MDVRYSKRIAWAACSFLLIWIFCTGCGAEEEQNGVSPVSIVLRLSSVAQQSQNALMSIPDEVKRIEVQISGPDMITRNREADVTLLDRRAGYVDIWFLRVPNGEDRIVIVNAFDSEGNPLWAGESSRFTVPLPEGESIFVEMSPLDYNDVVE